MRFEVNVDKKYFFFIIVVGLLLIGIVGVIAYVNPLAQTDWNKDPANFGHSVNEIDWKQTINKNITVGGYVNASYFIGDGSGLSGVITGTGGGLWQNQSTNVYYNVSGGNVSIGTADSAGNKLRVYGNLRVDGLIKGDPSGNVVIQLG